MTAFADTAMMSADEDSTSSPDDDPYDDTDILNSAGTDEVTAHLAAAGENNIYLLERKRCTKIVGRSDFILGSFMRCLSGGGLIIQIAFIKCNSLGLTAGGANVLNRIQEHCPSCVWILQIPHLTA